MAININMGYRAPVDAVKGSVVPGTWFLLNSSVAPKLFDQFTSVIHEIKGLSIDIHIKIGHTPAGGRSLLV